ncbi:hypothetical protein [Deinococcus kurensis]|uniref:hypothetical protein n=1 Tax=Deinococcus kurensis TaxID=2662757 RepID=UPI0012D35130|nr:hypothetical protein [Deinococcus kurensis]
MNYKAHLQSVLATLPPRLAARPRDHRGLPVPYAQRVNEDGTPDFTALEGHMVLRCARKRLCGICGQPLGVHTVFLGGAQAAGAAGGAGSYTDPPMHVDCAEFSLKLCPHLFLKDARRAADVEEGVITPDTMALDKPLTWVMVIARGYQFHVVNQRGEGYVLFLPQMSRNRRTFTYDPQTHTLTEAPA